MIHIRDRADGLDSQVDASIYLEYVHVHQERTSPASKKCTSNKSSRDDGLVSW